MRVCLMRDLCNPELYVPRRSFSPVGTALEISRTRSLCSARRHNMGAKFAHAVKKHPNIAAQAEGAKTFADPMHSQLRRRWEEARTLVHNRYLAGDVFLQTPNKIVILSGAPHRWIA